MSNRPKQSSRTSNPACLACGGLDFWNCGYRPLSVRDLDKDGKTIEITLRLQRLKCVGCGKTASPRPTHISMHHTMTKRLVEFIQTSGMSSLDLSQQTLIPESTIRSIKAIAKTDENRVA